MTIAEILLLVIGGLVIGLLILVFLKVSGTKDSLSNPLAEQLKQEKSDLLKDLEREKEDKNKQAGNSKQLYADKVALTKDLEVLREKLSEKERIVSVFEAKKEQQVKEHDSRIEKLNSAEQKLKEEQDRVRREDEEKMEHEKAERARRWNEHENDVLTKLREICKQPEIQFENYDNNNLPESFDGGLKPDVLVEIFKDQYIIFDAKFSENKVQTYFRDQVPKTVAKIKKSKSVKNIYPTVYFVVPSELLKEAKKLFSFEQGYSFFMISTESLAPILSSYKKITEYEFADHFNPQDRENIVNTLAGYESFIMNQNAANILVAEKAVGVVQSKDILGDEIVSEIELKRKNIKPMKLKDSEMKKLTTDISEQQKAIGDLVSPEAKIKQADLKNVQENLL